MAQIRAAVLMATEEVIEMPEPARSGVDFVSKEDRRYFEDHPQARFYDRAPHPLEFWPGMISTKNALVRVFQIIPGFRIRCSYPEGSQPDRKTMQMVKELRRACRKSKMSVPPRDSWLEDIHFVTAVR